MGTNRKRRRRDILLRACVTFCRARGQVARTSFIETRSHMRRRYIRGRYISCRYISRRYIRGLYIRGRYISRRSYIIPAPEPIFNEHESNMRQSPYSISKKVTGVLAGQDTGADFSTPDRRVSSEKCTLQICKVELFSCKPARDWL